MKRVINTDNAPGAIGPYSQAINVGHLIFTSGQLPIDPATKEMPKDITAQTKVSLSNVKAILESEGLTMSSVVKTTVYLSDIKEFAQMNEVYKEFFDAPFPARSAFEVANLPLGAKVEIEVIAHKG